MQMLLTYAMLGRKPSLAQHVVNLAKLCFMCCEIPICYEFTDGYQTTTHTTSTALLCMVQHRLSCTTFLSRLGHFHHELQMFNNYSALMYTAFLEDITYSCSSSCLAEVRRYRCKKALPLYDGAVRASAKARAKTSFTM